MTPLSRSQMTTRMGGPFQAVTDTVHVHGNVVHELLA
jgi:hypothetical protein